MTDRPRAGCAVTGTTSVVVASTVVTGDVVAGGVVAGGVVAGGVVAGGVVAGTGTSSVVRSPATGVDVVTGGAVSVTIAGAGAGAAVTVGGAEGLGVLGAGVVTAGLGDGVERGLGDEDADVVTGLRFTRGVPARGFMTSRGRLDGDDADGVDGLTVGVVALMPPRCSRSAARRVTKSRDSAAG